MAKKLKKMAVLTILHDEAKGVAFKELLRLLGPDYAERSVRRWLSEMVKDGIVIQTGKKRGTHYKAASLEYLPSQDGDDLVFSEASQKSLNYVAEPIFKRDPVAYNAQWLEDYQPNINSYLSSEIKTQLFNAGSRTKEKEPAGTYARRIYDRLLIDLSYNSSRLEGNTYSLLETERLILEGEAAEGKLDEEKIMILNHKEAIRHLIDNADTLIIDTDEICTLHYLLSDGLVPAQYAGKVRDHGVRIGGSTYIPYENPKQLMHQLKVICEKAKDIQDPYEQSFFLLTHIAYLQAFFDVNKRTSRLSANIPLILKNCVPLSFNNVGKKEYSSAMIAIYELNDVNPLIDLYKYFYLKTCQSYNATIEAMRYDAIRVRYRTMRRSVMRYIIVNQLVGKEMQTYIESETEKKVGKEDQSEFIKDVQEDIQEISSQRISGMGITKQELEQWLEKLNPKKSGT
ncbi:MAG: Fic family protein [Proteobacteria bacterium]|nr:Fic family protein [Pseudomonadota bacterium]